MIKLFGFNIFQARIIKKLGKLNYSSRLRPVLLIIAGVLIIATVLSYRFYFSQKSISKIEGQSQIQSVTSPDLSDDSTPNTQQENIDGPNSSTVQKTPSVIPTPVPAAQNTSQTDTSNTSTTQETTTNQTSTNQPSSSPNPTQTPATQNTSQKQTLENNKVGYRLNYPAGWQVKGAVVSSEFQASANECQSVEIVDSTTGEGGATYYHSGVQVCAKSLNDNQTLDDFMINTYGNNLSDWFTKTTLNGIPVYQSNTASGKTIFLQTGQYRTQIYTFVSATQDKQAERAAQVEEILQTFSLI